MRVILQGSLQHFTASELLLLIGERAHTGTFNADSSHGRVRLAFQTGGLAWAEASGASDPQTIVNQLVQWGEGTFTFLDQVELPDGAKALGLEIAPLVEEAEVRAAEVRRVKEIYPDDQTVLRVNNQPAIAGQISLSQQEFQVLFQFGAGRSLAQVLVATKRSAMDLYPLVRELETHGLLERVTGVEASSGPVIGEASQTRLRVELPKAGGSIAATPPPSPAPIPRESKPVDVPHIPEPKPEAKPERPKTAAARPSERKPPEPKSDSLPKPAAKKPAESKTFAQKREDASAQDKVTAKLAKVKPALVGTLTSDTGTMHPLLADSLTIGRTDENGIVCNDASISSKHARVDLTPEGFVLEDLGSRNGTFVNGEKVTAKRLLADGDLVRLGKVILTFNLAVETDVQHTTQAEIPHA